MTGSTDDGTAKPSFGWLFSTITALGLLLFLAVSFAFYHRRLMLRRKKEAEYNRFFRFLRPDLDMFDKKITRARSILTNTHSVDSSFMTADSENYNEGLGEEDDAESFIIDSGNDNKNKPKISYADWAEKRQDDTLEKKDHDIYCQSIVARKQVLLADVHADVIFKQSDKERVDTIENIKTAKRKDTVDFDHHTVPQTYRNNNPIRQNQQNIVSHGHSMVKHCADINNDPTMVLKKKPFFKPLELKKNKRGLLSDTFKKSATSLDEESIHTSLFYSELRRCSEPSLFLYNDEAADPEKSCDSQNHISLNPYYTDVSMPMTKTKTRRHYTSRDENKIDVLKSDHVNSEMPLPLDEKIQVPASTWM
ncbi:uncharacterized protein LOC132754635 [Ruditapes philippinarum]|uniref:uncharacterized protein LOC132754635 n=1 Tax=Ruditapes philippinarum TaxID=129788 RepID=UPI00295B6859|nr:uncharacterized protein LOC132754635 [Ruditapes philippinarum]